MPLSNCGIYPNRTHLVLVEYHLRDTRTSFYPSLLVLTEDWFFRVQKIAVCASRIPENPICPQRHKAIRTLLLALNIAPYASVSLRVPVIFLHVLGRTVYNYRLCECVDVIERRVLKTEIIKRIIQMEWTDSTAWCSMDYVISIS